MEIRERIVGHTTKMFINNGVKSVRMDDIASEMGISKRTIYEIFGDKERLIMECLDYFYVKMREHSEALVKDTNNVIEEYLMVMSLWDKTMDATYNIMNDVRKFYPKIYDEYTEKHMKAALITIKEQLQRGISQGYLLETLDIDLAITILGLIHGMMKSEMLKAVNASERKALKFIIMHFIRGISSIKGIEVIDNYFEKYNN